MTRRGGDGRASRRVSIAVVVALVCAACVVGVDPSPTDAPTKVPTPAQTQEPTSSPIPTPNRTPRLTPLPTLASAELFDGSFFGWRFAPDEVLRAEGLERNLAVDCEPREYGSDHPTDLDFEAEYLPDGRRSSSVVKWACGEVGLSVVKEYSFEAYPGSSVILQRALWGSKSADLSAPASTCAGVKSQVDQRFASTTSTTTPVDADILAKSS